MTGVRSGMVLAMKRTLTLKSESLTDLTTAELQDVAGGQPPTYTCYTAGVECFVSLAVCEIVRTIRP